MRASLRMAQERADALVQLRADNVLELAGLRVRLVIVDPESILEQPFRKPMSPDHIPRAALPPIGQLNLVLRSSCTVTSRRSSMRASVRTGSTPPGVRMCSRSARLPFFPANPDLFQQMVEVDSVVHGDALVHRQVPVSQLDAPIGLLRDVRVVRNHQNRVPRAVQLAEKPDDDLFIRFVQIACGLIRQDHFG